MEPAINYPAELARVTVFWVLLLAAAGKAMTWNDVKANLTESFRIPLSLSGFATNALILFELLLAVGLMAEREISVWSALIAGVMFLAFGLMILVFLVQDKIIRCNCFGNKEQRISWLDLVRNSLLIGGCGYYVLTQVSVELSQSGRSNWMLTNPGITPTGIEQLLILICGLIMMQLIINLSEIKALVMAPLNGESA